MSARLLVVDDEKSLLEFLTLLFKGEGHEVHGASCVEDAKKSLMESTVELVLCDLYMPDGSGLDLLKHIKEEHPDTAVIVMTAYTSTKSAIEAMRLGAYDYISKPFDLEELKLVVQKALEKTQLVAENIYLRRELEQRYAFANIIGRSRAMQEIFALIDRVARTSSTVLITGESGTGKELIARAIHFTSPRSRHRFPSINCGALPENLLESELFGYERGAFTGATRDKKGLFHEGHQGTVFLDEISEMSPNMQVKLLRVLQSKVVRRVGSTTEEAVDARIITATNRDLNQMVADGEFREDLFYRINVIPIQLPPLRRRREDIPLLVQFFITKYCEELELEAKRISVQAMRLLEAYDWPGNVRELENVIERALALSSGDSSIGVEDLPPNLTMAQPVSGPVVSLPDDGLDLDGYLETIRGELMAQALEREDGVQNRAAKLLGMTFRSFRYYAKKAGLIGQSEKP